MDEAVYPQLR